MTAACPYCRTNIAATEESVTCEACGTVHHADCYAENGGCTIFGCSKAPADEPKLSVSVRELVAVGAQAIAAVSEARVAPPPPPRPGAAHAIAEPAGTEELRHVANSVVPSIFGGFATGMAETSPEIPPQPKSRTTFIVLGVLLGAFGAHSFYAGYKKKGAIQLAITALSLGFAGPMSWVWAVIDICTITQDEGGVEFEE
jgi:TM2 domain-containing membrane protein YozV